MGQDVAREVMSKKKKLFKEDVLTVHQIPTKVTDENVDVLIIQRHCSRTGWREINNALHIIKENDV